MGNRPPKIQAFYKRILQKKKVIANPINLRHRKITSYDSGYDEDMLLIDTDISGVECNDDLGHGQEFYRYEELLVMEDETNEILEGLKQSIYEIEDEHKKRIQKCMQNYKYNNQTSNIDNTNWRERQIEECRLRNVLVNEKFKNCIEYLKSHETRLVERETKTEDNFLRKLLFKTAKRQLKKNQLNEAVETLCQLIIATNGYLNNDEMQVFFEVSKKKIDYIYQFYDRITNAVKQIDDQCSKFVIDELWSSVIEDLKAECAETYDIVMKINPEDDIRGKCFQKDYSNVYTLKYLTASTICALWLQLTSTDHDEFEDIKDIFFENVEKYVDIFALNTKSNDKYYQLFNTLLSTLNDLVRQCPIISKSKRMNKIISELNNCKLQKLKGITSPKYFNNTTCFLMEDIKNPDSLQRNFCMSF